MCSEVVSLFIVKSGLLTVLSISGVYSAALESIGIKKSLYEIPGLGNRPLIIKAYPAVENYQSDLYEVYAEPYIYNLRSKLAVAVIRGEDESQIKGEILFLQKRPPVGPTVIRGNITGLPAGRHGFHIHQSGDLRQGCQKLGEHFNPYQLQHGGPTDPVRHAGDLGNIEADENGVSQVHIVDPLISLSGGPRGVVGRAIVITSEPDDLGHGNSGNSLTNGDSGNPIACGIISYIR
ncbi:superoxide dismutase [Cu-Zn]-like [Anoplophora glabripennis]|uniref:superoxide dismutase [Cu-Zn]-like n=1 Tax=Anoplophora glabripennis TaxID=217634 RepID=UPI000874CD9B|nr:superoxide dismutase [Cu-Zn]-like [Anoplophora glabripennis]